MAEDLTDDWWEGADKKAEVEEEEEKAKTVEKKKRRKKRKFEEIVDSNVMSSEDQVKVGLSKTPITSRVPRISIGHIDRICSLESGLSFGSMCSL